MNCVLWDMNNSPNRQQKKKMAWYGLEMLRDASPSWPPLICVTFVFSKSEYSINPILGKTSKAAFSLSEGSTSWVLDLILHMQEWGPCLTHCEQKWLQKEFLNMVIWEDPMPECSDDFKKTSWLYKPHLQASFPLGHDSLSISWFLTDRQTSSVCSVRSHTVA